jgi:DNA polymerase-3 subunit epsilon
MSGWHTGRMVAFDTETTGPLPEDALIVSACVAVVGGGQEPRVRKWLVNPGIDIPAEATAVHGITTEQAQADGMPPGLAAAEIRDAICYGWEQGWPVVAFNAVFDLTVLDRELIRHHGQGIGYIGPVIDPFVIDRELDKYRKGSRKLSAQVEHYQVRLDAPHQADADALAAARLAWRLATLHPTLAGASLADLQQLQAAWHKARQADFAAYLRRTGKPADDVSGDWPIRPTTTTTTETSHA